MIIGVGEAEADAQFFRQFIVGAEGVGVVSLAGEGRAQDATEALHLEVVVTGGYAIGRVDRQGERTAISETDAEGQGVARVLEVGQGRVREVHEGALGREGSGKCRILAVLEQEARCDHPARSGGLGGAGVKIVGDFQAGGGVEVDVAVVTNLDERRRRGPVGTLNKGGSGESRGSDEEARHRVGLGLA